MKDNKRVFSASFFREMNPTITALPLRAPFGMFRFTQLISPTVSYIVFQHLIQPGMDLIIHFTFPPDSNSHFTGIFRDLST